MNMDPRTVVLQDRLAGVGRVIGVTGSKGGIGKSVLSSTLALALADRGMSVGLFDLDFTSPSDHIVLGVDGSFPTEGFGVDPHLAHGIRLMSVAFFLGDTPVPLRGTDGTGVLVELMAITRWGDLDVLILDMPPGLGDTSLDVIRLIPGLEFLLVGTASRVVIGSVRRAVRLLDEMGVPMVGLVENMQVPPGAGAGIAELAREYSIPFLGSVPFDPGLEGALGDVTALRGTAVFAATVAAADRLIPPGR